MVVRYRIRRCRWSAAAAAAAAALVVPIPCRASRRGGGGTAGGCLSSPFSGRQRRRRGRWRASSWSPWWCPAVDLVIVMIDDGLHAATQNERLRKRSLRLSQLSLSRAFEQESVRLKQMTSFLRVQASCFIYLLVATNLPFWVSVGCGRSFFCRSQRAETIAYVAETIAYVKK